MHVNASSALLPCKTFWNVKGVWVGRHSFPAERGLRAPSLSRFGFNHPEAHASRAASRFNKIMQGGINDLDTVTLARDRRSCVRHEHNPLPMGYPATPSRGGSGGAAPGIQQLMSGIADSKATDVSLSNRDIVKSDAGPDLGASSTVRGTCFVWDAEPAESDQLEEHQHQHQQPHTYDDAGLLRPPTSLGATFSLLDTPAAELYCEPPVLPLPGAVPPPPAAAAAVSPGAAGREDSPRSTTCYIPASNDLYVDPDQDSDGAAHCGGGVGLELHLLMAPGDLQAAANQLQLQQQPPDEGGGSSSTEDSGRLSTATTAAVRLLLIYSWERYGGAGAASGTVTSCSNGTSSRSSSRGLGSGGSGGGVQHSAGGQAQQLVVEPSCVDVAAGRVTARVPLQLFAGLHGQVPGM